MDPLFSDWYHSTGIDVNDEELKKRWLGVERFVEKLEIGQALNLVRLFGGALGDRDDFKEKFGLAIQEADATFRLRNNDHELRILAGAALVETLRGGSSSVNDATALAVVTATCGNLVLSDTGMRDDVVSAAKKYLLAESVSVRSADHLDLSARPSEDIAAAIEKFKEAFNQAPMSNAKETLAAPLELLKNVTAQQSSQLQKLQYEVSIQREESNMTWWVIGGYSRDLNESFANRKVPEICLIAAKELENLTVALPGPRSAAALLHKILQDATTEMPASVSVREAVNGAPEGWRKEWLSGKQIEDVADFCPIHLAVQKSVENKSWTRAFEATAKIKATQRLGPLDLALQTYNEALLLRVVKS